MANQWMQRHGEKVRGAAKNGRVKRCNSFFNNNLAILAMPNWLGFPTSNQCEHTLTMKSCELLLTWIVNDFWD
jgi:hypothetical protein